MPTALTAQQHLHVQSVPIHSLLLTAERPALHVGRTVKCALVIRSALLVRLDFISAVALAQLALLVVAVTALLLQSLQPVSPPIT